MFCWKTTAKKIELISRWNCTQSHKIRFVETIPRLHSLSHISPSTFIPGLCHQSSNLSPSPARNSELSTIIPRLLLLLNWCVRFSSSPKNPPKPEWGLDQATNRTNSCILDSFRQTPFSGGSLTHPEPSINSCPVRPLDPYIVRRQSLWIRRPAAGITLFPSGTVSRGKCPNWIPQILRCEDFYLWTRVVGWSRRGPGMVWSGAAFVWRKRGHDGSGKVLWGSGLLKYWCLVRGFRGIMLIEYEWWDFGNHLIKTLKNGESPIWALFLNVLYDLDE